MIPLPLFALMALMQTAPAPATTPAPQTPPAPFIAASQAYGVCIGTQAGNVAPSTTPEDGARQTIAACAAQRKALDDQLEAWITGPTFPEGNRELARTAFNRQMTMVEERVAAGLRSSRGAPAPTSTPAPTPTPAP